MSASSQEKIDPDLIALLKRCDTPTICNALDIAAPDKSRSEGFTQKQMLVLDKNLPPIVAYARTAKISSISKVTAAAKRAMALKYYAYTAASHHPVVIVIEDIDDEPGLGAHWGEVHTALHQALGAEGAITNGSFRDVDDSAAGFQILAGKISPSHAYVHIVEFGCDVNVFGMPVSHNDLVHADKHGAVVIPANAVAHLPAAIATIRNREKVILDSIKQADFNIDTLTAAVNKAADIH